MPKPSRVPSTDEIDSCSSMELAHQRDRFLSKLAEIARKARRPASVTPRHELDGLAHPTPDDPVSSPQPTIQYTSQSPKHYHIARERPADGQVVPVHHFLMPHPVANRFNPTRATGVAQNGVGTTDWHVDPLPGEKPYADSYLPNARQPVHQHPDRSKLPRSPFTRQRYARVRQTPELPRRRLHGPPTAIL